MSVIAGSGIALAAIIKNSAARTTFCGASTLQSVATKIRNTLNAATTLFTKRASDTAMTEIYNANYGLVGYSGSTYTASTYSDKTSLTAGALIVFVSTMGYSSGTGSSTLSVTASHLQTGVAAGSLSLKNSYQSQAANLICVGGCILSSDSTNTSTAGMKYDAWEAQ
jgi:hypothetical protein